jgi:EpsI family protein
MQVNNRNYIIAAILLILAFIFTFKLDKANRVSFSCKDFTKFPQVLGNWTGKDIPLEENVYKVLQTRDVLMREYKDKEGNSLALVVVYSENDRAVFHPPEICYLGGGIQLLKKQVETIPLGEGFSLKANTLTMQQKKSAIKAWYWFTTKDKSTPSFYEQQLNILLNWLKYHTKEGALIRISAVVNPQNSELTELNVKDFVKNLLPALEKFFEKKLD